MRWADNYTLQHRIPPSVARAHASTKQGPASTKSALPLTACLRPKPILLLPAPASSSSSSTPILTPGSNNSKHPRATMGSSWNPFSVSPNRRSSSYRPGYASSSYSSSSRHHSSTSRYKRSPRDNYMQHLYKKLQHFLREIWRYAQRHPYKVFFMIIMPLVSGGVLHKLARQFGVNLPQMGNQPQHRGSTAGGYYGSQGYGRDTYTSSSRRSGPPTNAPANGGGGMMASLQNMDMDKVAGGIGGLATLASMASKFV
ncbi:hypothetical protein J3E72DRAFT_406814 [Bipolaris maydis]|nr:hypothetical protein J3E73DRAFT_260879 [Bipolaris maydis]KAJ5064615.1 hypothetical protein J3E74DRAFT_444906 [Bipolaris maydis]KAJ6193373.1 hypothetical protein J3E72DRAFT_406814 [Bipolaris maydis]KAJ6205223.1 hypothetical protein PSV09DRAFT_2410813 [Bipolaris maydis]KAJ6267958.1 hypothetical protein PSV08DRAFT_250263 [Bipolaris maydis]